MHGLILFILTMAIFVTVPAEKVQYISTERPVVSYYNTKYVSYANITSRRLRRGDPFHYVNINLHLATVIGNNVTVSFYFFEYLSNVYKRSFVELHLGVCELIEKDQLFGSALRKANLTQPCPLAPGAYNMNNMTILLQHVPRNFPFKKGRIFVNVSRAPTNEIIGIAQIDMEIKLINLRQTPANQNWS